MKAEVQVDVTLTILVEGDWQEGCSLKQVTSNAEEAARATLIKLHTALAKDSVKLIASKRAVTSVTLRTE